MKTASGKYRSLHRVGSKLLAVTGAISEDANTDGADNNRAKEDDYYSSSSVASRLLEYAKSTGVTIPDAYVMKYKSEIEASASEKALEMAIVLSEHTQAPT